MLGAQRCVLVILKNTKTMRPAKMNLVWFWNLLFSWSSNIPLPGCSFFSFGAFLFWARGAHFSKKRKYIGFSQFSNVQPKKSLQWTNTLMCSFFWYISVFLVWGCSFFRFFFHTFPKPKKSLVDFLWTFLSYSKTGQFWPTSGNNVRDVNSVPRKPQITGHHLLWNTIRGFFAKLCMLVI